MSLNLNSEQKQYAQAIKETMTVIAKNHIKLGQQLIDAKKHLSHGEFIPMLKSIGLNYQTARGYIDIAKLSICSESNVLNLTHFNNSQIKKLDKMEAEEAQIIIDAGEFPEPETKAPAFITGAIEDMKDTKESLRKQLNFAKRVLQEEMNKEFDVTEIISRVDVFDAIMSSACSRLAHTEQVNVVRDSYKTHNNFEDVLNDMSTQILELKRKLNQKENKWKIVSPLVERCSTLKVSPLKMESISTALVWASAK